MNVSFSQRNSDDFLSLCDSTEGDEVLDHPSPCQLPTQSHDDQESSSSPPASSSRNESHSSQRSVGLSIVTSFDPSPCPDARPSPLVTPSPRLFDDEFASPLGPSAACSPVSSYGFISLAEYQSVVDEAMSTPTVWIPSVPPVPSLSLSLSPSSHSEAVVDHDSFPDVSPRLSPRTDDNGTAAGNHIPFSSPRRNAMSLTGPSVAALLPSIEFLQQEAKLEKLTAASASAALLSTIVGQSVA